MINPIKPEFQSKIPKMDFPYYTPFMEGRNRLEALMESASGKPEDYFKNEFLVKREFSIKLDSKENKFKALEDKTYKSNKEIYEDIKAKKPVGNYTFWIDMNWTIEYMTNQDGTLQSVIWMRGAWCDSKFLDQPIKTCIENHIPKEMMDGY